MLGIIPAAGVGSRIQPLAFSKELLPVGSRVDGEVERPRAVSEYLVERMTLVGCDKICSVIGPQKSDIVDVGGEAARRRILAEHTYAHRAAELERLLDAVDQPRGAVA